MHKVLLILACATLAIQSRRLQLSLSSSRAAGRPTQPRDSPTLKTGRAWNEDDVDLILDPDGWDRSTDEYDTLEITFEEYLRRKMLCTCIFNHRAESEEEEEDIEAVFFDLEFQEKVELIVEQLEEVMQDWLLDLKDLMSEADYQVMALSQELEKLLTEAGLNEEASLVGEQIQQFKEQYATLIEHINSLKMEEKEDKDVKG